MLVSRTPRVGSFAPSSAVTSGKVYTRLGNAPKHCSPLALFGTCGRAFTVAVFAKKDHNDQKGANDGLFHQANGAELQAYMDRERFLLSELAAARSQVDKLLDQQQLLLGMISRLSGLGIGEPASGQLLGSLGGSGSTSAATPAAWPQLPQSQAAPPSGRPSAVPGPSASGSRKQEPASSNASAGSTSSDVPALTSLAELFKSAAAAAPHPASAAAAASIAAAVAAVDSGDILSINKFDIPPRAPQPQPQQTAPVSLPQPSLVFDTLGGFTAADSSSEAQGKALGEEELPVEVAKAAPTDPPPDLVQGDDDIFWLSKLHGALEERGFFPGDDDMENWFFGETTLAAVLSFQASERLPETGVVDRPTWTALLGTQVAEELYGRAAAAAAAASGVEPVKTDSSAPATSSSPSSSSSAPSPSAGRGAVPAPPPAGVDLLQWPVLMEGDGGREVHALQVALANNGFHCGEDDMRWWQFGDATLTALKYFQSCNSLPESGVCDERCWRALLGGEAAPGDLWSVRLAALNSDDEDCFEDDMEGRQTASRVRSAAAAAATSEAQSSQPATELAADVGSRVGQLAAVPQHEAAAAHEDADQSGAAQSQLSAASSSSRVADLEAQVAALAAEKRHVTDDLSAERLRVLELRAANDAAAQDASVLRERASGLEGELRRTTEQLHAYKSELHAGAATSKALQAQLAALLERVEQGAQQLAAAEEAATAAELRAEELGQQVTELRGQLEAAAARTAEAQAARSATAIELAAAAARVRDLEQQMDRLAEQLERNEAELEAERSARHEARGQLDELQDLHAKLEATVKSLKSSQEVTARELIDRQGQIRELESRAEKQREKAQHYKQEAERATCEVASQRTELDQARAAATAADAQVAQLSTMIANYEATRKELDMKVQAAAAREAELVHVAASSKTAITRMEHDAQATRREVGWLGAKLGADGRERHACGTDAAGECRPQAQRGDAPGGPGQGAGGRCEVIWPGGAGGALAGRAGRGSRSPRAGGGAAA
ncbi:hypothetical protein PLESTB_001066700 [Pleodorina starrii]|uniref:Peptidoglycan binding-like domain-containing protein n=1 Tax=Pleodorina starrii TaxID=330485 RepID=A0A9W6BQY9_9CHLO|nr:hypothetical protein PLESTB_001066700 [Pleodorina starrii]